MDIGKMEYRNLGPSGLKVSVIGFGNMTSGFAPDVEQLSFEQIDLCVRSGINFFDTAQIYGHGVAETILGRNLKQGGYDRDELVISTKFMGYGFGIQGLSRKFIRSAVDKSLERLQLDNVDVLFLHRPDRSTPLEEQCRIMNKLIDDEKTYYWGTSEFTPQEIAECIRICDKLGLEPPIVEQCEYSMVTRDNMENKLVELFEGHGLGTTIWSPLAGGILTGKYNDGNIPEGARYTMEHPVLSAMFARIFKNKEKTVASLQALGRLAEELGITQAQLAVAWAIKNNDVSTCLVGASSVAQLEANIGAFEASKKLTPEILQRIEEILDNRPVRPLNFKTWTPLPPRRGV